MAAYFTPHNYSHSNEFYNLSNSIPSIPCTAQFNNNNNSHPEPLYPIQISQSHHTGHHYNNYRMHPNYNMQYNNKYQPTIFDMLEQALMNRESPYNDDNELLWDAVGAEITKNIYGYRKGKVFQPRKVSQSIKEKKYKSGGWILYEAWLGGTIIQLHIHIVIKNNKWNGNTYVNLYERYNAEKNTALPRCPGINEFADKTNVNTIYSSLVTREMVKKIVKLCDTNDS